MFSINFFSFINNSFCFMYWAYFISIFYLFCEEILSWKLGISMFLSLLLSTKLMPYFGFPLFSLILMIPVRYSIPLSETFWEKMPFKCWKMKSYLLLLMQSFVCVMIYIFSTFYMIMY